MCYPRVFSLFPQPHEKILQSGGIFLSVFIVHAFSTRFKAMTDTQLKKFHFQENLFTLFYCVIVGKKMSMDGVGI